ncbi:MAG: alpha/beta hydrolase [Planctomycetota bacterium]
MKTFLFRIDLAVLACVLSLTLVVPASLAQPGYAMQNEIAYYGDDAPDEYAAEHCRLDVYHPENAEGFTTVVWLHAGGLRVGNRYIPGELRGKGFAIVPVDYRLSPRAKSPAFIEDAAAAVAWTIENIADYGGDPDRVIVAGASAGAYLALLVGLDPSWLETHGIDADRLLGIGALAGHTVVHERIRWERGIKRTVPTVDELAPLFHVRADAPPILLVTGDRELELLGRWEENALLARMLKIEGHDDVELYELEGFDHAGVEKPAHGLLLRWIGGVSGE